MMSVLRYTTLALVVVAAGCAGEDRRIGDVSSPDGKHHVELRSCSHSNGRMTQVTVLPAGQSDACMSFINGLVSFDVPYQDKQLKLRWLSNDVLEAGHPNFEPGGIPHDLSMRGDGKIRVIFTR